MATNDLIFQGENNPNADVSTYTWPKQADRQLSVKEIIGKVDVTSGIFKEWNIRLEHVPNIAYGYTGYKDYIKVTIQCPVRGAKEDLPILAEITTTQPVGGDTDREILKSIYKAVQVLVRHELQEMFLYDNERVFDPHNNETRLPVSY